MHLLPLLHAGSVPCVDHHPTHLLVQAVHLPSSHLSLVAHAQVEVAGVADGGGGSCLEQSPKLVIRLGSDFSI